jgi:hypothetical protein
MYDVPMPAFAVGTEALVIATVAVGHNTSTWILVESRAARAQAA